MWSCYASSPFLLHGLPSINLLPCLVRTTRNLSHGVSMLTAVDVSQLLVLALDLELVSARRIIAAPYRVMQVRTWSQASLYRPLSRLRTSISMSCSALRGTFPSAYTSPFVRADHRGREFLCQRVCWENRPLLDRIWKETPFTMSWDDVVDYKKPTSFHRPV